MRTLSILLFLMVAISFCLAASPASVDYQAHQVKRRGEEQAAPAATTTTTGHGAEGSAATSTTAAAAPAATTTAAPAKKKKNIFATPAILTTGTFFYIGIAVTFVLWCTGFALDFLSARQEQLAYKTALSKKHCCLSPEYPAALKA